MNFIFYATQLRNSLVSAKLQYYIKIWAYDPVNGQLARKWLITLLLFYKVPGVESRVRNACDESPLDTIASGTLSDLLLACIQVVHLLAGCNVAGEAVIWVKPHPHQGYPRVPANRWGSRCVINNHVISSNRHSTHVPA